MLLGHLLAQANDITNTFGTVSPPPGVDVYNTTAGGIGLILFVSRVIRTLTIVAGVWVLFNIISAGFDYISSSGDSSVPNKVKDKIQMSVLGLVIIIAAYTIIAIISFVLFGNPGFILSPQLQGPAGLSTP